MTAMPDSPIRETYESTQGTLTQYYSPSPDSSLYKWDIYYLKMAKLVASKSKRPSTRRGAVLYVLTGLCVYWV